MFVNGISSSTARNDNGRRKVNETDVAVAGGGVATASKATRGLVQKMTVTTKGVNEGAKYVSKVAEEAPKIASAMEKNRMWNMARFAQWAKNSKLMKFAEPVMHNPIVKKAVGAGTGILALAYAGNELGQLLTSGTQTFDKISNMDFNMTA